MPQVAVFYKPELNKSFMYIAATYVTDCYMIFTGLYSYSYWLDGVYI